MAIISRIPKLSIMARPEPNSGMRYVPIIMISLASGSKLIFKYLWLSVSCSSMDLAVSPQYLECAIRYVLSS